MASLSQITGATRKILEVIAIAVIGLIAVWFIFTIGKAVKDILAPTPPAPPTVSFGKLPPIDFPNSPVTQTLTYTINTLSGNLPQLPDRVTVYKLTAPQPNLLGLDRAKTIAAAAGFKDNPTMLSETSYKWTTTDPFPMNLTMDIQSFDFSFTTSYTTNQDITNASNIPSEDDARKTASGFFDTVLPLPDSIDSSKTKTTLFTLTNGKLVPASSLSNTQVVRVDFFPQDVEKMPIYTANPTSSLLYALVGSSNTLLPQVIEAQYIHKQLSTDKATYPIKTAKEAFEELKSGKGFVANYNSSDTNVSITNVTLGYYEDVLPQQYLMPIIVFQGDNGFFGYVSAIQNQWIQ